jgi:excinuclease ABC subunit A
MASQIKIFGARQHNLKNIDVSIPRDALVVVTGLSGSGKSSLAFDTLYAEGQRRYVESLSAYARQFLERLQKPDVEHIEGLSPAIAIEQRSAAANPRSVVATATEIHDYLRLLYAHIGTRHCPHCGRAVSGQSAESIAEHLLDIEPGCKFMLLAPYVRRQKRGVQDALNRMRRDGFARARVDGEVVLLEEDVKLSARQAHTCEAVVDRLVAGQIGAARLVDSVELALRTGDGEMTVLLEDPAAPGGWREEMFSERLACPACDIVFSDLAPRDFSFNSPYGACRTCHGLGRRLVFLPELVVPDPSLSLRKGGVPLWRRGPRRLVVHYNQMLRSVAAHSGFDLDAPWEDLPDHIQTLLLYGSGAEMVHFEHRYRGRHHRSDKPFEGIIPNLQRRYVETDSEAVRQRLRESMVYRTCPDCQGARLRPESLAVTINGHSIAAFCALGITDAAAFVDTIPMSEEQRHIAGEILREIRLRLHFLRDVGLGYLTLDRESSSLSGGEAQRIRLATQVGSGLTGVLYVLDEPTIGLHQRENLQLLQTLEQLRDLGNTVVIVEHDLDTIRRADYLVDLGPGAGREGGFLVCAGTPTEVEACSASLTGQFLAGVRHIAWPLERQAGNGQELVIAGAREHNLKNIDVAIPLGTFCCVTGVSGSGKSTLVDDILKNALHRHFRIASPPAGEHDKIHGLQHIHKMIVIDQSPIGRTPRSNPATYTNAFTLIRDLFARLPEARTRGYRPGRFSFNVKGGRCEDCKGDGIKKIEMNFLPDVYVQCETCRGKRYNRETLGILYRGRSIADVLDMTVDQAAEFFANVPRIRHKLETLSSVGLGYIHLGQAATTLSGGEAQRVKLAAELAKRPVGHTLYILDEPTTGLHLADVERLLKVLLSLRDHGNTVLIIEHNIDVIKMADHLIDLGPEGGDGGGRVVACGTPEEVAGCSASYTGKFLREVMSA